jgi:hypothetical protein
MPEGTFSSGTGGAVRFSLAYASGEDPDKAAFDAASAAIGNLGGKPRGILFFESYEREDESRAAGMAVDRAASGTPNIGVFAEALVNGGVLKSSGVAVLAVGGEKAICSTMHVRLDRDRYKLGEGIGMQMQAVRELKLIIALSEPHLSFEPGVDVEGFLHGVSDTLGPDVMLWGGNGKEIPADSMKSRQFCNGQMFVNEVVAMGIGGAFDVIGENQTEFMPCCEPQTVTKNDGKWVLELGGKPAAQVYRACRGMAEDEPFTYDDLHPVGVILDESGHLYVRQILEYDREREALRFISEIPAGSRIHVLKGGQSVPAIYDSARAGIKSMLDKACGKEPLALFVSNCCARGFRLDALAGGSGDEVANAWLPALSDRGIPVFSFYAYGEIGPIPGGFRGLNYQYQQHSFVAVMLAGR